MSGLKRNLLKAGFLVGILCLVAPTVKATYVSTNRDTLEAPSLNEFTPVDLNNDDEFDSLGVVGDLNYFYNPSKTIIGITDLRNNYTWYTGLDLDTQKTVTRKCTAVKNDEESTEEDIKAACKSYESNSDMWTYMMNSLITIEYFSGTNYDMSFVSSADISNSESNLKQRSATEFALTTRFFPSYKDSNGKSSTLDISIVLRFDLTEKGLVFKILSDEITGKTQNVLSNIIIAPFLGATGGKRVEYKPAIEDGVESYLNGSYDTKNVVDNDLIPGYSFVPDGSGALLRFEKHNVSLSNFVGKVWGTNASEAFQFYRRSTEIVDQKNISIPVYGIAHGQNQNAFLAYCTSGAEEMTIYSYPSGNTTQYNFTYAKFNYNSKYFKVYNKAGDGSNSIYDKRLAYDVEFRIDFLEGDGTDPDKGFAANYVGMAKDYQEYLLEQNVLTKKEYSYDTIPLRADLIMSDVEDSVLGLKNSVVTNTKDADKILNSIIHEMSIENVTTSLMGYQDGGITTQSLKNVKFTNSIGSKRDFKNLIQKYQKEGVNISFNNNYYYYNSKQGPLSGNAAKHYNGQYDTYWTQQEVVDEFMLLKPSVARSWSINQMNKLRKYTGVNTVTISGISDHILSTGKGSVTTGMDYYESIFATMDKSVEINADQPNSYLWSYIDRYFNAEVFNSQYLIETDTVPFLEMVLYGCMELYAPYANFSFYNQESILRMIDYSISPSFVLSMKSSEKLSDTNSSNYFSTEFDLYKETISNVYTQVNSALKNVINTTWVNREILENGVVCNTYSNGTKIIINYTNTPKTVLGTTVLPESYGVI